MSGHHRRNLDLRDQEKRKGEKKKRSGEEKKRSGEEKKRSGEEKRRSGEEKKRSGEEKKRRGGVIEVGLTFALSSGTMPMLRADRF